MIGTREYRVAAGQEVRPLGHRTIGITTFADAARVPSRARRAHQRAAGRPALSPTAYFRAAGGIKIYHLDRWESPEPDLLKRGALM